MLPAFKRPTISQQRKAHCIQKRASVLFFMIYCLVMSLEHTHTRDSGMSWLTASAAITAAVAITITSICPIRQYLLSYFCQFISLLAFTLYHVYMQPCGMCSSKARFNYWYSATGHIICHFRTDRMK